MDLDCSDARLDHLSFIYFLKAAASNERINKAAKSVYERRYSRHVDLNLASEGQLQLTIYNNEIRKKENNYCNLQQSNQFFRCFGNLINSLSISFDSFVETNAGKTSGKVVLVIWREFLFTYINEYCCKSFITPFVSVTHLQMKDCNFSDTIEDNWLNSMFPQMQKLTIEFSSWKYSSFKFLENHFPSLEHLTLYDKFPEINSHSKANTFRESVLELFHLNQQLKHLTLRSCSIDANTLQSITNNLQNLEGLELEVGKQFFAGFNGQLIRFKNLKMFTFKRRGIDDLSHIPITSDKLEKIFLEKRDFSALEYDFIKKNPTIKELTFIPHYARIHTKYVTSVAGSLPGFIKVTMVHDITDSIISKWTKIDSLNEISIQTERDLDNINDLDDLDDLDDIDDLDDLDDLDYLKEDLSNEWSASIVWKKKFRYINLKRQNLEDSFEILSL